MQEMKKASESRYHVNGIRWTHREVGHYFKHVYLHAFSTTLPQVLTSGRAPPTLCHSCDKWNLAFLCWSSALLLSTQNKTWARPGNEIWVKDTHKDWVDTCRLGGECSVVSSWPRWESRVNVTAIECYMCRVTWMSKYSSLAMYDNLTT